MDLDTAFDYLGKTGPLFTFLASMVAARIAWRFGKTQERIATQQAKTALGAAHVAQNKFRLELREERLEIYDAVTSFIEHARRSDSWRTDVTPYFQAFKGVAWIFDDTVAEWVYGELQETVRDVTSAHAACVGVEAGEELVLKRMAVVGKLMKLDSLHRRRDEVFGPFLRIRDTFDGTDAV